MLTAILISLLAVFFVFIWAICILFKNERYILVIMVVASPYIAYKTLIYFHYKSYLPDAINVSYPISINEEGGFREGCGIAIFRLSDSTLEGIESKGVTFLKNATQARGHSGYYNKYEPWSETPVPKDWIGDGRWLICSHLAEEELLLKIVSASKKSGAYYTKAPEAELVIVPSLKLVIFSSFG